jgi:hypothetical protein
MRRERTLQADAVRQLLRLTHVEAARMNIQVCATHDARGVMITDQAAGSEGGTRLIARRRRHSATAAACEGGGSRGERARRRVANRSCAEVCFLSYCNVNTPHKPTQVHSLRRHDSSALCAAATTRALRSRIACTTRQLPCCTPSHVLQGAAMLLGVAAGRRLGGPGARECLGARPAGTARQPSTRLCTSVASVPIVAAPHSAHTAARRP